jgi:hypothetical protein
LRTFIGEVADILVGYQVREGLQTDPAGTHFVIQAKDIDGDNDHRLKTEGLDRVTPTRNLFLSEIRDGDILFLAKGRRRFATLVEELPDIRPAIALSSFFVLRPKPGVVDPTFLSWLINESQAQAYLNSVAHGTTVPSVTKKSFLKLEFTLPSLDKQVSIGHLHSLACRERSLTRKLECQRSEYLRSLCRALLLEARS